MTEAAAAVAQTEEPKPLRLDFGCGKNPRIDKDAQGNIIKEFEGVDSINFGQRHVFDLRSTPWPWADESVAEAHSSHFVEHLTGDERVVFFNELYRVLAKGAQAMIVTPHWSNDCAYGDPTHQWPPISSWTYMYLNKAWRDVNAPHVGYTCDFDFTYGFQLDAAIATRTQDYQMFAINHYRNGARDLVVTLTKQR